MEDANIQEIHKQNSKILRVYITIIAFTFLNKNIFLKCLQTTANYVAEILKRLDDPTDKVRVTAIKTLPLIVQNPPEEFMGCSFQTHHDFIIDTLLTHLDDDEVYFRTLVFGMLI